MDFAAGVLPIPTGDWSIFALLSADDARPSDHGAVLSWIRRSMVAAVAGAFADAHGTNHAPPSPHIDDTLQHALVHLDDDARTGQPWARHAGRASVLLAFFDSKSRTLRRQHGRLEQRQLRVRGTCRAQCAPLPRARACADVHGRCGGARQRGRLPSRGPLDASSVETRSVEVRDGNFLVLGSEGVMAGVEGTEAEQAVSEWTREQEEPAPEGRHQPHDPVLSLNFPLER